MRIISNCVLCKEKSLHVVEEDQFGTQQCVSCGYASTNAFKLDESGDKESNENYKNLTDDMKKWSRVENNRVWIPSVITLPFGMLYPFDDKENNMKWSFAPMVEIPEDERKNFPTPDGKSHYERRYNNK